MIINLELSLIIPPTCTFLLLKAWLNTIQVKIHLFTLVCLMPGKLSIGLIIGPFLEK